MGLTADNPVTLVQLGDVSNPLLLLGAGAFVSMIVMEKKRDQRKHYYRNTCFQYHCLDNRFREI